jgi:hypothetical protein
MRPNRLNGLENVTILGVTLRIVIVGSVSASLALLLEEELAAVVVCTFRWRRRGWVSSSLPVSGVVTRLVDIVRVGRRRRSWRGEALKRFLSSGEGVVKVMR